MKKLGLYLGRALLAAGACLTFVVVLEAHEKMVDANPLTPSTAGKQDSAAFDPQRSIARANAQTKAADVGSGQGRTAQRQPLALNAGGPGEAAQNIAQTTPQFAYSEWAGASFPVEDFQAYTSPFGYRQSVSGYNYQEFHYGLDLAAPRGSYIRNWWSGTVVEVSDNSNCGTSVVVESGRWLHIYCHMEGHVETSGGRKYMIDRAGGVQIFEGQEVTAGQRIGRVGMTGRTTGPHLHWGMKYDNNWVDPALVLRAMYGLQQQQISRNSIPQLPTQQARLQPESGDRAQ